MPDTILTRIEKIAAGGAGLAKIKGKTAFIEGSVPGETVLCRIINEHRSWLNAELLEVVESSPDRVQPICPFYGKCGGCNLQHLSYTAQIAAKTVILKEAFIRIGGLSPASAGRPPTPQVVPSEEWEYRNRMQFHTAANAAWGLKARRTNEVIPINDCPIADPGIRAVLKDDGRKTLPPPAKDRFNIYSRNGLFLSETGTTRGKTRILGREIALDAGVFFQSNGTMLEKLLGDLEKIAGSADRSLPMADIYCGVGTFAVFLGEMFPHVDLVEENTSALTLARENLLHHKSAAFYARRSEQWAQNGLSRRYGFIIADPPRHGLNPVLTRRLAAEPKVRDGPSLLAYVSCDPATLARDSKILIEGGYELTKLLWYDFYPQTAHIESLAVFIR